MGFKRLEADDFVVSAQAQTQHVGLTMLLLKHFLHINSN